MSKGSLEIIVGCMSSGKTEELVRLLRRAEIAKQKVMTFKPKRDDRNVGIASRSGCCVNAIAIADPLCIPAHVDADCAVVAIDEAQFFDDRLITVVNVLIDRGIRVLVAALDTDYNGNPFGIVPYLMAIADSVLKVRAICIRCGREATRTKLLVKSEANGEEELIIVGGDDIYEARCRDCHTLP